MVAFFVVMCVLAVAVLACLVYLTWAMFTGAAEFVASTWRTRIRPARQRGEALGAES